jgi:hypothetical protein
MCVFLLFVCLFYSERILVTITSVSVKLLYVQIPLVFSFLPYSLNSDLCVCLGSAAPHSMMVKRRCVYSEPTGYSTPVCRISDVTTTQIENPSTRRHDWRPFPVMAGTKLCSHAATHTKQACGTASVIRISQKLGQISGKLPGPPEAHAKYSQYQSCNHFGFTSRL